MSIEARLFTHLSTHAGLQAIVGTRIYPVQMPQGATMPAVLYLRVSNVVVQHRNNQQPTYSRARFQIEGWTVGFDATVALRRQLRAAMGSFSLATEPRVDTALLTGDRDLLEAEPDRWRCVMDYMIMFQED